MVCVSARNLTEVAQKPILLLLAVSDLRGRRIWSCWSRAVPCPFLGSDPVEMAFGMKLLGLGATMMFTLGLLQSLLPMPKDTPFEHLFDRPRDAYLLSIIAATTGP
jgi:hypothetical protein